MSRCPTCHRPFRSSRTDDHASSAAAAAAVDDVNLHRYTAVRRGSHRHWLLAVYGSQQIALSDRDAAVGAGLAETRSCWWKWCSELRWGGLIAIARTDIDPDSGHLVNYCSITPAGLIELARLREGA